MSQWYKVTGALWGRSLNNYLDCQIDAWTVVQGHRLSHKCELQKNAGCVVLSCSKKNFAVLYSDIVNLTNGGKYGITIRLHGSRLKGLDKRRAQPGSSFCLDDDVHRHERDHGKKQNRGFVPDRIYAGAWNGSLDSQTIHPSCKKMDQKIDRLQMQRWAKIYGKVHEPMGQILQGTCVKKNARKTKGGEKWIKDLCPWFEKRSRELLLSTIVKIVLLRQLKKYTYLFAAGIVGPSARWKKLNWEGRSSISLSSTVNTLQSADKTLENSLPSNPGREIAWGFFMPGIEEKGIRNRPQAKS